MKKILIPIGLFFVARWIFGKKQLFDQLTFEISNVRFNIGLLNTDLIITVILSNPTANSITVNNISGNVFLNNISVGSLNTAKYFTIDSRANTTIELNIRLSNISVGEALMNVIKNRTGILNFTGTVSTTGVTIPVNVDYKIG